MRARRAGMPEALTADAARAERRLARKFGRSTVHHRKRSQVAVNAVARELAGFIWAVMVGRLEPKGGGLSRTPPRSLRTLARV